MSRDTFHVKYTTLDDALSAFRSGLKHGLLTFSGNPSSALGDAARVDLELVFASQTVTLYGHVAHTGAVATVIQFEEIPPALYVALGQTPPVLGDAEQTLVASTETASIAALGTEVTDEFGRDTTEFPDLGSLEGEMADTAGITRSGDLTSGDDAGQDEEPGEESRKLRPRKPQAFRLKVPDKADRVSREERGPRSALRSRRVRKAPDGGRAPVAVERKGIPLPGLSGGIIAALPVREGSLTNEAMRDVLMDVLRGGTTGVLVVEGFRERFWCFLVDGRPVRFVREPSGRSESLEYLAARGKVLNAGQANHARQLAELSGLTVETVLERLDYVPLPEIHKLQKLRARKMTERLLGVNYGSYHLFELDEARTLFPNEPADVMLVLWERSRERFQDLPEKKVAKLIDANHKLHVVLTKQGRALVQELSLRGTEQSFLDRYLRGGWQVAQLLGRLDLPNRTLLELLLALQDLGIVVLSEDEGPNWRLARAERYLIDRMDYMDRDHFAFVEAHWSCLPEELRRSCNKVEEMLQDPIMEELEIERVAEMRNQIRDKLAEVRRIFDDAEQRRAYRAERIGPDKRKMAADLFLRQGEMALFKKDQRLTHECFSRVLELDPSGSGSGEMRARARDVLRGLRGGELLAAREEFADERDFDASELDEL